MTDKQIDIFGNETSAAEIDRREKRKRKRYRTMQEIYGVKEGVTCKTCKHAVRHRQAGTWYKCELWAQTHSAATDIRLKDPACNKYEWEGVNYEK